MDEVIICGGINPQEKSPCKCCNGFCNWGVSVGTCCRTWENTATHSTCEMFDRDTSTFTEDNEFLNDEVMYEYYA